MVGEELDDALGHAACDGLSAKKVPQNCSIFFVADEE